MSACTCAIGHVREVILPKHGTLTRAEMRDLLSRGMCEACVDRLMVKLEAMIERLN